MNRNTYKDISCHIIFSTKNRSKIITSEIMKRLRVLFREKAAGLGVTIH